MDMMPLIDFAFSLLVYFMMTYNADAGKLSSIVVNLPSAAKVQNPKDSNIIVSVNDKNEIYINDKQYSRETLLDQFKKIKLSIREGTVVIRGDKKTNYDTIIKVMDDLNQAGIHKFTLATIQSK
jgi:biopolymer transport protein ExbD